MSDNNVIPFPAQLRIVPRIVSVTPAGIELIEHDGRTYLAPHLIARLSLAEREEVEATAPRTAQAAWDEAVRLWPALADEIAATAEAVE